MENKTRIDNFQKAHSIKNMAWHENKTVLKTTLVYTCKNMAWQQHGKRHACCGMDGKNGIVKHGIKQA